MNLIKQKAKLIQKEISKDEAEKILKQSQLQEYSHNQKVEKKPEKKLQNKKSNDAKIIPKSTKTKSTTKKIKKVSKK